MHKTTAKRGMTYWVIVPLQDAHFDRVATRPASGYPLIRPKLPLVFLTNSPHMDAPTNPIRKARKKAEKDLLRFEVGDTLAP